MKFKQGSDLDMRQQACIFKLPTLVTTLIKKAYHRSADPQFIVQSKWNACMNK